MYVCMYVRSVLTPLAVDGNCRMLASTSDVAGTLDEVESEAERLPPREPLRNFMLDMKANGQTGN